MGEIFIRLGQYNNADIAFSTALHFEGQNARWWARLGYARETGGDYANAQAAYENALKLNSGLHRGAARAGERQEEAERRLTGALPVHRSSRGPRSPGRTGAALLSPRGGVYFGSFDAAPRPIDPRYLR